MLKMWETERIPAKIWTLQDMLQRTISKRRNPRGKKGYLVEKGQGGLYADT